MLSQLKAKEKEGAASLGLGHTACKHRWCPGQSGWEATTPHAPHSPDRSVPSRHAKQEKAPGPHFPLTAA